MCYSEYWIVLKEITPVQGTSPRTYNPAIRCATTHLGHAHTYLLVCVCITTTAYIAWRSAAARDIRCGALKGRLAGHFGTELVALFDD